MKRDVTVVLFSDNGDIQHLFDKLSNGLNFNLEIFNEIKSDALNSSISFNHTNGDRKICFVDWERDNDDSETALQELTDGETELSAVIILVKPVDELHAVRLMRSGISDYIVKPVAGLEQLSSFIARKLELSLLAPDKKSREKLLHIENLRVLSNLTIEAFNQADKPTRMNIQSCNIHSAISDWRLSGVDIVVLQGGQDDSSVKAIIPTLKNKFPYMPVVVVCEKLAETSMLEYQRIGADIVVDDRQVAKPEFYFTLKAESEKYQALYELDKTTLELHQQKQQLQSASQLHELVFAASPDAIFVKDAKFRIVTCNDAFLNLYPPEERPNIIGTTTLEMYDTEEADGFLEMDKQAFKQGLSQTFETVHFPTGEQRTLFTIKKRFYDSDGHAYILGVSRDVTEREVLIEQLRRSNNDLEEFAYTASHDLKSPLQGIMRVIQWIEEDFGESIDEKLIEHLDLIKSRALRMNNLLKDLLDYSRITRVISDYESFDFSTVEEHLKETVLGLSNFKVSIPQVLVFLPQKAVFSVLFQLCSNAVKHHHSENGEIQIHVQEGKRCYEISVSDNGPGIDMKHKQRIFKMFQTLKPRDKVEGSGMGLAVARKIVESYGGIIELSENSLLTGATFVIEWPKQFTRSHQIQNSEN